MVVIVPEKPLDFFAKNAVIIIFYNYFIKNFRILRDLKSSAI